MKLEVGNKYRVDKTELPYKLVAIDKYDVTWGLVEGVMYSRKKCDIIGEWQDKPDPGEGWRLLHPEEDLEAGDEFWSQSEQTWIPSLRSQTIQCNGWYYRRRIAPQYVPYTWDDREELRGKWYRKKGDNSEFMVNYVTRYNENDIALGPWRAGAFFKECEWLDGSPCGKKVV